VTFAAGLRVIDRSEAIAQLLDCVKLRLIRLMSRVIRDAIALVVEACGRFGTLQGSGDQNDAE
jgi:hypothetical protein